jgi:hypothetical protein
MAFVLQNTVDPPICNLFEASLPYRFILTFPLMPYKMMGLSGKSRLG